MKKLYMVKKLVNSGVVPEMDTDFNRRIRLSNQLVLCFLAIGLPYVIIFRFFGLMFQSWMVLPCALLISLTLPAHALGAHNFGRIWLSVSAGLTNLFFALSLGKDAGIQLMFFPFICLPLVLFDLKEKFQMYLSVLFTLICFISFEFLYRDFPFTVSLSESFAHMVYITASITAILTTFIYLRFYLLANEKSKQALKSARDALSISNFELAEAKQKMEQSYTQRLEMSHQKLTESYNELKKKTKVIERSAQMASLGTLSMGICDDIRKPLASIRYESEKLGSQPILTRIDELEGIVDAMMLFSKQEGGMFVSSSLASLLEKLKKVILPSLSRQNIDLVFEIDPALLIYGDLGMLRQMLLSLVSNARDAIKKDGAIHIIATQQSKVMIGQEKNGIEIIIKDTGSGIPKEQLDDIFHPYFSTKGSGHSGMGLAVVHRVLELHQGTIEVDSEPGLTKFTVWLPY